MNMFPKEEQSTDGNTDKDEHSRELQRKTADTTGNVDDEDCLVIDQSDEEMDVSEESEHDQLEKANNEMRENDNQETVHHEEEKEVEQIHKGKQLESLELDDDQMYIRNYEEKKNKTV